METRIEARGQWGTVEFVSAPEADAHAASAFDGLSVDDQAKMSALFKRLADHGVIKNREKFKAVEGFPLFEFKQFQHRFVGFFQPGARFVIAAYELKKRDDLRRATIDRALNIKRQFERESQHATPGRAFQKTPRS